MKTGIATLTLLAAALSGCGGGAPPPAAQQGSAPLAGTATPDEANGAAITGKVVFSGTPPEMRTIDMSASPACQQAHAGEPVKAQEVVVGERGALRWAFVWVKSGLAATGWAIPSAAPVLDQNGCLFEPHVIGVMTGQNVEFQNHDSTNHNLHSQPRVNPEWNESQPPDSGSRERSFARPEIMVPLKCNIHPWMRAYIGVVAHPFFAVTGADGTFTIRGLPPGTYTIETWHEKFGVLDQQVTVGPHESKSVDFVYKG